MAKALDYSKPLCPTVEAFLFLVLHLKPSKVGIDLSLSVLRLLRPLYCCRILSIRLRQHFLIHRKLNRIRLGPSPQIIHSRLQPLLPRVKVHARQFAAAWLANVHVHALALADERATIGGHVNNGALRNLPDSFVDSAEFGGDFGDILDGATVGNDFVADFGGPEASSSEVAEEVLVDAGEFSSKDTTVVHVARKRLRTLIIPQDLGGTRRGHRTQQ
mmetsp:Transcript_10680/g.19330  ORF Transcript_10680/g.19330 Transcript_10680/m.19330 type:complete len:217 (+) Transcript_10680:117-767(+)